MRSSQIKRVRKRGLLGNCRPNRREETTKGKKKPHFKDKLKISRGSSGKRRGSKGEDRSGRRLRPKRADSIEKNAAGNPQKEEVAISSLIQIRRRKKKKKGLDRRKC